MLTAEKLSKIEQDAQKATPGPWQVQTSCSYRRIGRTHRGDGDVVCGSLQPFDGHPDLSATMSTLEHIANCDPQTVMELVKMARRALFIRENAHIEYSTGPNGEEPARLILSGVDRHLWDEEPFLAIDSAIEAQRKEGG